MLSQQIFTVKTSAVSIFIFFPFHYSQRLGKKLLLLLKLLAICSYKLKMSQLEKFWHCAVKNIGSENKLTNFHFTILPQLLIHHYRAPCPHFRLL